MSLSTKNYDLEVLLKERDKVLDILKMNLQRAQQAMKVNADKHRREVEFQVGDLVLLKLRPYRQQSVAKRFCQKLAAKYYGPYEILEKIGPAAYRLNLPAESKIHSVFHVSQLKRMKGKDYQIQQIPPSVEDLLTVELEPESILAERYTDKGVKELLVKWKGHNSHDDTWVSAQDFKNQFPQYKLEGKLALNGGGIDKIHQVYFRRKKKFGRKEESVQGSESKPSKVDELAAEMEEAVRVGVV